MTDDQDTVAVILCLLNKQIDRKLIMSVRYLSLFIFSTQGIAAQKQSSNEILTF